MYRSQKHMKRITQGNIICFPLRSREGTLAECYDELGNRYQLPVYCLAPPVNLISERSDEDPSDSPEPPVAPKKEFQLKVCFTTFIVQLVKVFVLYLQ